MNVSMYHNMLTTQILKRRRRTNARDKDDENEDVKMALLPFIVVASLLSLWLSTL